MPMPPVDQESVDAAEWIFRVASWFGGLLISVGAAIWVASRRVTTMESRVDGLVGWQKEIEGEDYITDEEHRGMQRICQGEIGRAIAETTSHQVLQYTRDLSEIKTTIAVMAERQASMDKNLRAIFHRMNRRREDNDNEE